MNFNEDRKLKVVEIEKILKTWLPEQTGYQGKIMEAMEYNFMAGGKRIRPMLMQETYKMFGGTGKIVEPFMAALEMIHTYSLIHDDLPAMDNDDYRRGRKTTHVVYGEAMGILTGDALLNCAFETASKAFDLEPESSYLIGKALQILSKKAGVFGMIGGQVIDIESSGHKIDAEKLNVIYELKTSALLESAMMVGAVLAGAKEEEINKIEQVAKKVGIAFQIQDDVLDVISTEEELGKPIHSDEKNEKTTYVTLVGLKQAQKEVEKLSMDAMCILESLDYKNEFLMCLIKNLVNRKN